MEKTIDSTWTNVSPQAQQTPTSHHPGSLHFLRKHCLWPSSTCLEETAIYRLGMASSGRKSNIYHIPWTLFSRAMDTVLGRFIINVIKHCDQKLLEEEIVYFTHSCIWQFVIRTARAELQVGIWRQEGFVFYIMKGNDFFMLWETFSRINCVE